MRNRFSSLRGVFLILFSLVPGQPVAGQATAGKPEDNPLRDGWETEFLQLHATVQFKKLGPWISKSVSEPADADLSFPHGIFIEAGTVSPLRPGREEMEIVSDGPLFEVHRPRALENAAQTSPRAPQQQFTTWLQASPARSPRGDERPAGPVVRFTTKVIGIERHDQDSFTTRQAIALFRQLTPGSYEQNAVWEVRWRWKEGGEEEPAIESISLERASFEEVEWTSRRHQALFSDLTGTVLGSCPEAAHQLGVPAWHWLRSLSSEMAFETNAYQGLALGDANGDGIEDLYVCQGAGLPNRLLLGQPDGGLREAPERSGVDWLDKTTAALFADLDNDGDQDLIIALAPGVEVMENVGSGVFRSRSVMASGADTFSLAASDYDADGRVDLFLCVYRSATDHDRFGHRPAPELINDARNGGRNILLRNRIEGDDWKFEDVTNAVGLDVGNTRFTLAASWEDYDNDGDQDLYVANDFGVNQLYRQGVNAKGEVEFTDVAESEGVSDRSFGMSAGWGDWNRDGCFDLYVSNMFSSAGNRITTQPRFRLGHDESERSQFHYMARGNSLFTQQAAGKFQDDSVAAGVTIGRWAWANAFADIDLDGREDLLVTNGYLTNTKVEDDL